MGFVAKYVAVQCLLKKTCVVTEICCVLLAFIFPDFAWCWWHIIKQKVMEYLLIGMWMSLEHNP